MFLLEYVEPLLAVMNSAAYVALAALCFPELAQRFGKYRWGVGVACVIVECLRHQWMLYISMARFSGWESAIFYQELDLQAPMMAAIALVTLYLCERYAFGEFSGGRGAWFPLAAAYSFATAIATPNFVSIVNVAFVLTGAAIAVAIVGGMWHWRISHESYDSRAVSFALSLASLLIAVVYIVPIVWYRGVPMFDTLFDYVWESTPNALLAVMLASWVFAFHRKSEGSLRIADAVTCVVALASVGAFLYCGYVLHALVLCAVVAAVAVGRKSAYILLIVGMMVVFMDVFPGWVGMLSESGIAMFYPRGVFTTWFGNMSFVGESGFVHWMSYSGVVAVALGAVAMMAITVAVAAGCVSSRPDTQVASRAKMALLSLWMFSAVASSYVDAACAMGLMPFDMCFRSVSCFVACAVFLFAIAHERTMQLAGNVLPEADCGEHVEEILAVRKAAGAPGSPRLAMAAFGTILACALACAQFNIDPFAGADSYRIVETDGSDSCRVCEVGCYGDVLYLAAETKPFCDNWVDASGRVIDDIDEDVKWVTILDAHMLLYIDEDTDADALEKRVPARYDLGTWF